MLDRSRLSSRRDLTFRQNAQQGRHGWLRLTPAYSVNVVSEILRSEAPRIGVLDPYSGTGTTALCASESGLPAQATDINPFLVWLARAKTARYSAAVVRDTRVVVDLVSHHAANGILPVAPPPIHNIERWWPPPVLHALCAVRAAIEEYTTARSGARRLLDVAFCRTVIGVSAAAFNHQSMSFKTATAGPPPKRSASLRQVSAHFRTSAAAVIEAVSPNPLGATRILIADARDLKPVEPASFDLVVTSPPYVNRMSYIRELRPYMYWLGYLENARDAGELDWRAVGGTWGIATSRIATWVPASDGHALPLVVSASLRAIRQSQGQSADLLARYVHKYFGDVRQHIAAVAARIAPGGRVHYIVGNSSFYGQLVPTEQAYAELLREAGFAQVAVKALRKRNSKRELVEFDVVGTMPQ